MYEGDDREPDDYHRVHNEENPIRGKVSEDLGGKISIRVNPFDQTVNIDISFLLTIGQKEIIYS
jgi:hypothetical protein